MDLFEKVPLLKDLISCRSIKEYQNAFGYDWITNPINNPKTYYLYISRKYNFESIKHNLERYCKYKNYNCSITEINISQTKSGYCDHYHDKALLIEELEK